VSPGKSAEGKAKNEHDRPEPGTCAHSPEETFIVKVERHRH
jgi:hypothetical protein